MTHSLSWSELGELSYCSFEGLHPKENNFYNFITFVDFKFFVKTIFFQQREIINITCIILLEIRGEKSLRRNGKQQGMKFLS